MSESVAFSDHSFRQFLSEEKLMGCQCKNCHTVFLPPKPICTNCFSRDLVWVEMPKTGKLAAFTCITVGPPAMQEQGYNRNNPYCSGVVEVKPGVRVDARIEEIDPKKPEQIKIGTPMKVAYIHRETAGDGKTYLAFKPE